MNVLKIVGVTAIVFLAFTIGDMVLLWSVNWMAELGGSSFYVPHTVWSYCVASVFLLLLNIHS